MGSDPTVEFPAKRFSLVPYFSCLKETFGKIPFHYLYLFAIDF